MWDSYDSCFWNSWMFVLQGRAHACQPLEITNIEDAPVVSISISYVASFSTDGFHVIFRKLDLWPWPRGQILQNPSNVLKGLKRVILGTFLRPVCVSPERPRSQPCRGGDRSRWWHHPCGPLSGRNRPLSGRLHRRWSKNLKEKHAALRRWLYKTTDGQGLRCNTDQDTVWNTRRRISGGRRRCSEQSPAMADWCTALRWCRYLTAARPGQQQHNSRTHKLMTEASLKAADNMCFYAVLFLTAKEEGGQISAHPQNWKDPHFKNKHVITTSSLVSLQALDIVQRRLTDRRPLKLFLFELFPFINLVNLQYL